MEKNRLEAFSDGVLAIVITIMVLGLQVPHSPELPALLGVLPAFLTYVLSFAYIAIYWTNHHHMMNTVRHVTGGILWANIYLLFWLSLVPFATAWMGENHFVRMPTAIYGAVLLMSALAYFILQSTIVRTQGAGSLLARAVGRDLKGKVSLLLYIAAIFLAFVHPRIAQAIYTLVALMWMVPDRRIERVLGK